MCGDVPEDFYAVVGRIVMVSAVLELKLLNLAQGLDRKNPQSAYAGKPAGRLITSTRKLLDTPGMENFRDDGNALLSRVAAVLEDRNAVVHNAWPNPTLKDASGWRPVMPRSKRTSSGDDNLHLDVDEAWWHDLILRLVQLVEDLAQFGHRVQSATNLP